MQQICAVMLTCTTHKMPTCGGHHTTIQMPRPAVCSLLWGEQRTVRSPLRRSPPGPTRAQASTTATTTPTIKSPTLPKPRHVCIAVDGTDTSIQALEWVLANLLEGPRHDVVHLAHVVSDSRTPQMAVDGLGGRGVQWSPQLEQQQLAAEWQQRLEEQGRQLLMQRFVPPLRAGGVAYEIDVLRQRGAKSAAGIGELLCAKAGNKMWALVVASHGAGVLADYGSVAQYCVQHAQCPLVLLPPTMGDVHGVDALIVSFGDVEHLAAGTAFAADALSEQSTVSAVLVNGGGEHEGDSVAAVVADHAGGLVVQDVTTLTSDDEQQQQVGDHEEDAAHSVLGAQLCAMVDACNARMVVMHGLHGGLVQELMYGAALAHVLRHCGRPVVLLKGWGQE